MAGFDRTRKVMPRSQAPLFHRFCSKNHKRMTELWSIGPDARPPTLPHLCCNLYTPHCQLVPLISPSFLYPPCPYRGFRTYLFPRLGFDHRRKLAYYGGWKKKTKRQTKNRAAGSCAQGACPNSPARTRGRKKKQNANFQNATVTRVLERPFRPLSATDSELS